MFKVKLENAVVTTFESPLNQSVLGELARYLLICHKEERFKVSLPEKRTVDLLLAIVIGSCVGHVNSKETSRNWGHANVLNYKKGRNSTRDLHIRLVTQSSEMQHR